MATVTKPMALDETLQATNAQLETTDATPVNIADVLQTGLANVASAISPNASDIPYDNTTSGLTADDVQEAIDELATEKADSSTTLAGYGITDAYTQTEADNLLSAKQNTLTFDDTPTESSTNPVKSGGVYNSLANKMSYADNGVLGAKNLLPLSLATIKSLNTAGTWTDNIYAYLGVNFTVNTDADGNVTSISTSGTSSAEWMYFYIANVDLINGESYILSGITGETLTTCRLSLLWGDYTEAATVDGEKSFTVSATGTAVMRLIVRMPSVDMSGKVFYPMIRLATDTDSTFQPYAMTNKELTSEVLNLDSSVSDLETHFPTTGFFDVAGIYTGNIDTISSANGYILRIGTSTSGTKPTNLGGNAYMIFGFSVCSSSGVYYGVQTAIGFGSSQMAIRNCAYNSDGTGTWSAWTYLSGS